MKVLNALGTEVVPFQPKASPPIGAPEPILTPRPADHDLGAAYGRRYSYTYVEPTKNPRLERHAVGYTLAFKAPSILPSTPTPCEACAGSQDGSHDGKCHEIATLSRKILGPACPCPCVPEDLREMARLTYPRRVCPTHGADCVLARCPKHDLRTILWYCPTLHDACPTCLKESMEGSAKA